MLIRALMFVLAFPLAGCMTISTVGGGGPNGVVYVTANDSLFASEASVYRCAPGDDGHYGCVELFDARVLERAPMVSPIDIESWGKTTGTPVPTAVSASGVDVPTEDEVPALDIPRVTPANAPEAAERVAQRFGGRGVHIRYLIGCGVRLCSHTLTNVTAGWKFEVGTGGAVRIEGDRLMEFALGERWHYGDGSKANLVEIWFDGAEVRAAVNGVQLESASVAPPPLEGDTGWMLQLVGPGTEIRDFHVEAWQR